MTRAASTLLLVVSLLAAGRKGKPPALAVASVRAVRLEQPAQLHRNAAALLAADPVLVTVASPHYNSYLFGDATPPIFMYGSGACAVVRELDAQGTLALLCPPPDSADERLLWLTLPGMTPRELNAKKTALELRRAIKMGHAARVEVSAAAPLRFPGVQDLRAWLRTGGAARDGGTP